MLTAAHCVDKVKPAIVQLGTHTLNDAKKKNFKVKSCFQHFFFKILSENDKRGDIAVVKLDERITFSSEILPACLRNNQNDLPSTQELVMTGWEYSEGKIIRFDRYYPVKVFIICRWSGVENFEKIQPPNSSARNV